MFGERLNDLIISEGLNKNKFAEALKISSGLVTEYIQGKKKPSSDNLIKIAKYFDVSVDYLLTGEEPAGAELIVPEELKNVRVAFHRGEFEDLTQDEVDKLAEFARFIKTQRSSE